MRSIKQILYNVEGLTKLEIILCEHVSDPASLIITKSVEDELDHVHNVIAFVYNSIFENEIS